MVLPLADQNRVKFFHWLKTSHPNMYRAGIAPLFNRGTLSGLWDSLASGISSILSSAQAVLPGLAQTYIQTKEQKDLLSLNLQRAKQGQAPVSSLAAAAQSVANDQAAAQAAAIARAQAANTNSGGFTEFLRTIPDWVKYGALALGIGALIYSRRKRRRR